jgi:gluconokinase
MEEHTAPDWAGLRQRLKHPVVVVVMGVSGSGKTTVAALLAAGMDWAFADADDLHPEANVEKMRSGHPLTDEDRWPWLERVAAVIDNWRAKGASAVITCSALKRAYRRIIVGDRKDVALAYLRGTHDLIAGRLAARHGHYMPASLLDSQFAALEEPAEEERPIVLDIGGTPQQIVAALIERLEERQTEERQ